MNKPLSINSDLDEITKIVQSYFNGIHHANVETLRKIFHPDAYLKSPGVRRSLSQWLTLVNEREVPAQQGADFDYRILSIDVIGDQAMVKLICPLFNHVYIDFLGLLKENENWFIVNKMYAEL